MQGSQYAFLAVDAQSKLIINSLVGQRSLENAVKFFSTMKERVAGRFQLNTDAWNAYSGTPCALNPLVVMSIIELWDYGQPQFSAARSKNLNYLVAQGCAGDTLRVRFWKTKAERYYNH
jgi:hypothetical protein